MNVYEMFRSHFGAGMDRVFIDQPGHKPITYARADREAQRLSAALLSLGLRRGDRVAVQLEKSPWLMFIFFACLRAGLVFVPLNSKAPPSDTERIIEDAAASMVVQNVGAPANPELPESIKRHTLGADGSGSLAGIAASAGQCLPAAVEPADLATIVYTSGTTGLPKGVAWSHGLMVANARTQFAQWDFGPEDVFLHTLPMFHSHGISVALNSVLLGISCLRFMPRFQTDEAIEQLRTCTVFSGVPTMYIRLLESPRLTRELCSGMRLFLSSSAALPEAVAGAFEARTGHRILECYGTTETGTLTSNSLRGERRRGTVGKALPGVELRVVSTTGESLANGQVGELQVRKPETFSGYWRRPEETAKLYTADGYFQTGDLATVDAEGYLYIVGRSKEVIVTGGFNVYPRELEVAFGRVAGVRQCVVLGVPHPSYGEAPIAVVVLNESQASDEQELLGRLREQLAPHKLPRRVFVVDAIARTPTGKVDVKCIRERYANVFLS